MNKAISHTVLRALVFFVMTIQMMGLNAQIYSPGRDAAVACDTSLYSGNDSIFVFFSPPGENVSGKLSVSFVSDSSCNFEWFQYDTITHSFSIPILAQSTDSSSTINNLYGGGFQVHIWDDKDIDTSFIGWVHLDRFKVVVPKDTLRSGDPQVNCGYLYMNDTISIDTFYYYDPINNNRIFLENGYNFKWSTSENADLTIYSPSDDPYGTTLLKPPALDTRFILTATDSFGMKEVHSVFYESTETEAKFRFQFYDPKEKEDFVDATPPAEGDGPLRVKFINESVNGSNYQWIFSSDSLRSGIYAEEFSNDSDYEPEFMYKIPGDYYPQLKVTSEYGCDDIFEFDTTGPAPIKVLPSDLEVPNVFTPDGNGQNDFFKVKFQSIKEFSIRIYDRGGQLVYKAEISDMYKWDGWDGNVLNSNRRASTGAYFYVIEATGWDKKFYHKGTYRGVVYLFREGQ